MDPLFSAFRNVDFSVKKMFTVEHEGELEEPLLQLKYRTLTGISKTDEYAKLKQEYDECVTGEARHEALAVLNEYTRNHHDRITGFTNLFVGLALVNFLGPKMERVFTQFVGTEMGPLLQTRWRGLFDLELESDYFIEVPNFDDYYVHDYEPYVEIDESVLLPEEIEITSTEKSSEDVTSEETVEIDLTEPAMNSDLVTIRRSFEIWADGSEFGEELPPIPSDFTVSAEGDDSSRDETEDSFDINALDDARPALENPGKIVKTPLPLIPDVGRFETNQLMMVKEVVPHKFESILECHEKVLARNDWKSLAMYFPIGDVPTCGYTDLMAFPVKHTSPEFIQMAIDEMLPGISDIDDSFFQELVETSDIALELDRATFDMSVFNDWTPKSGGRLNGLFQTGNISKRVPTFREASLAIKKRNLNVPDLQQVLHEDDEARFIANKFINTVIDPNKLAQFPGYISEGEMGYFNKYLSGKAVPDDAFVDPCALVSMDKYRHMIKTQLKPVEDTSQLFERPLAATITYHDKGKVMSTSPIFLMMCNRLLLCLNDKISIPSGNTSLFSLDPFAFEMTKEFKEIDFSKFDKSQQRLHHLIQFHIFTALGAPAEFIEMWFGSHEISHIRDGPCGVGFSVNYQRRTGDACTYLGNTITTLSALAYMYDLLDPNVTFVIASGDDSLIGSIKPLDRSEEFKFVTLFNFEAKFPHNQPFVCSKFLCLLPTVSGGKKVLAVPNALKLNIKLGVKDLAPCVFDAWYKSWLDLIWYFDNYLVVSTMKDYISHRYLRRQTCYQEGAMLAYRTIFSSREKCLKSLFGITSKDLKRMVRKLQPERKKAPINQITMEKPIGDNLIVRKGFVEKELVDRRPRLGKKERKELEKRRLKT
uniref:RNA-directed RNA polymerase 2a n=1 Tax=Ilarvirus ApMV TaxID=12319 RepID=A0A220K905_9BROM|nr:polymerase P2 [Apple mosaic virus]